MQRKAAALKEILREKFIDWENMRLKKPLRAIAFLLGVHKYTVREALRQLNLKADPQLNLHPYISPDEEVSPNVGNPSGSDKRTENYAP